MRRARARTLKRAKGEDQEGRAPGARILSPSNRKGQGQEAGREWLQEDSPAVGSRIVSFGWAGWWCEYMEGCQGGRALGQLPRRQGSGQGPVILGVLSKKQHHPPRVLEVGDPRVSRNMKG